MSSNIAASVYDGAFAVTPSNTVNDANGPFAALWLGTVTTGQTLSFVDASGNTTAATFGTTGSFLFPVRCIRVNVTGTTVTNVLGLKAIP